MVKRKVKKTVRKTLVATSKKSPASAVVKRPKPLLKKRLRSLRSSKKSEESAGSSKGSSFIKNGRKNLLDLADLDGDEELDYDDGDAVVNNHEESEMEENKRECDDKHEVPQTSGKRGDEYGSNSKDADDSSHIDTLNEHLKEIDELLPNEITSRVDSAGDAASTEIDPDLEERLLEKSDGEDSNDNESVSPFVFPDREIIQSNNNIIMIRRNVTNASNSTNLSKKPFSEILRTGRKIKKADPWPGRRRDRKWKQKVSLEHVCKISLNDPIFNPPGFEPDYNDVYPGSSSSFPTNDIGSDYNNGSESERASSLLNSATSVSIDDSIFKLPVKKPPSRIIKTKTASNVKPKFKEENEDLDAISLFASGSVIMLSDNASESEGFSSERRLLGQDSVEEAKNCLLDKWVEQSRKSVERNWNNAPVHLFRYFKLCYRHFASDGCTFKGCKYNHNIPNNMKSQIKALDCETLLKVTDFVKNKPVLFQHMFDSLADGLSKFRFNHQITFYLTDMIQAILDIEMLDRTRFVQIVVDALMNFGLSFKESIDLIIMRCGATKTNFCDILLYLIVHEGNICDNWDLVKKLTIWRTPSEKLDYNLVQELLNYCANSSPFKEELYENIITHIVHKGLVDLDKIHSDMEKCELAMRKTKTNSSIQSFTHQTENAWGNDPFNSCTEIEEPSLDNYDQHEPRSFFSDQEFRRSGHSDDFNGIKDSDLRLDAQPQMVHHVSEEEQKNDSRNYSSSSRSSRSSSRHSGSSSRSRRRYYSSSSSSSSSRSSISRIRNKSKSTSRGNKSKSTSRENNSESVDPNVKFFGDHTLDDYNTGNIANSSNYYSNSPYVMPVSHEADHGYQTLRRSAEPRPLFNYNTDDRYAPQPRAKSSSVDSLQQCYQMNTVGEQNSLPKSSQYMPNSQHTFIDDPYIPRSPVRIPGSYMLNSDDSSSKNEYNHVMSNSQQSGPFGTRSPLKYTTISMADRPQPDCWNLHKPSLLDGSCSTTYSDSSPSYLREMGQSSRNSKNSTHQSLMSRVLPSHYFGTLKLSPKYSCNVSLHNLYPNNPTAAVDINNSDIPLLQRCLHSTDHKLFIRLFQKYKVPPTIHSFILNCIVSIKEYGRKFGDYNIYLDLINKLENEEIFKKKELKATTEVIAFNLLIAAVKKCFYDDITKLLQKFINWDSLITSKVFLSDFDYSLMGRYLVVCKLFMRTNNFHWPNEILQSDSLNILRPPFYWPYDRNDRTDIALRSTVLYDFFTQGYKSQIVVVNSLYKFISKLGIVEGFDTWACFNKMLNCILDEWNENQNQNIFRVLFKDIVNSYFEHIDPFILRAVIIFAQGKFDDEDVLLLYTKCCTKGIYDYYEGNETRIVVKNNMLDQEITVTLNSYFHNMYRKWSQPPKQLAIEVKLAGVSCSYPEILKNSTRSIKDICLSLREVLKRLGINNFREDGTTIQINHQSLLNYYKYLKNKQLVSHRPFL